MTPGFVILLLIQAGLGLVSGNLLGSPATQPLNPNTPQGRIVGGRDTSIEDAPYQVLLESGGQGFCGGSIISADWVLTAAHCLVIPDDRIQIRAGTSSKARGGSVHTVLRSVRHENYRQNRFNIPLNDIALIQVTKPFVLDNTRRSIGLFNPAEIARPGASAVITGWGRLSEDGRLPERLQRATVPLIEPAGCARAYAVYGGLPPGQICAARPAGGRDTCQGDSGGPLVIDGKQAGVVSWGNGCARKGYPGVYTEVAAYRAWITEKTGV